MTVQGPVKKQQPDGMSQGGGGIPDQAPTPIPDHSLACRPAAPPPCPERTPNKGPVRAANEGSEQRVRLSLSRWEPVRPGDSHAAFGLNLSDPVRCIGSLPSGGGPKAPGGGRGGQPVGVGGAGVRWWARRRSPGYLRMTKRQGTAVGVHGIAMATAPFPLEGRGQGQV